MAALVLLVLAPAARAQSTPEPNRPCCPIQPCECPPVPPNPAVRAAFYYPWWDGFDTATQTPRPKWSECSTTWNWPSDANAHFYPDFNANHSFVDEKAIDLYDDGQTSTMVTHMQRMVAANITGLIASWWGVGTGGDTKLGGAILEAAHQVPGVDITAYYETKQNKGTTWEKIRAFFNRFMELRQANPSQFLYVDGRPVVFVYHPGNTDCAMLDLWNQGLTDAENVYGVRPFLVVDMANDVQRRCTNHSAYDYSWHEYSPSGSGYTETWAYGERQTNTLRPGFWRCKSGTEGQARSVSAWQSNVNWANAKHAKFFQLITSWNEWIEMTSVEPGMDWYSTSGLGAYLDILAQFPPQ